MRRHRPRLGVSCVHLVCVVALGALGIAGCSAEQVGSASVTPVELDLPVPSYALGTPAGLVVRSGEHEVRLPVATYGEFLPDGDVLIDVGEPDQRLRVLHPASGEVSSDVRTVYFDERYRTVTRLNVLERSGEPSRLRPYDLDLRPLPTVDLPVTDNPGRTEKNGLARNYASDAATTGDSTLVRWADSSEYFEGGDQGVLRIRHAAGAKPRVDNVLLNQRLVRLYVAADGSSVLAVQQDEGKPCGGCKKSQSIVEVDPERGELIDRGHPDAYDERWRVEAVDRVGDRIAVRYVSFDGTGGRGSRHLIGTYVYQDGRWSLLQGSDEKTTWWQDGGRVIARDKAEPRGLDGYALSWARDGEDEETAIVGEFDARGPRQYVSGTVPGQLLPSE